MTRKHFIEFAKSFKMIESYEARNAAVVAFSEVAKQVNPRFDVIKFRIACGV
jgi:hypothetical protein